MSYEPAQLKIKMITGLHQVLRSRLLCLSDARDITGPGPYYILICSSCPDLNFIPIFILASGHSHGSWLILLLDTLGSFSAFAFLFTPLASPLV